ncbi:uncharacterized protein BX664DRAFT_325638 [Halteromyces radiatus]|uniref:uncharacterized protein n=1 Tax=Halteromyces radiatus TaxID=101107 RepID=UPI00221EADF4|nr:uncharacterized protein BX664DRAFT_325638 [Halteromyces radiatus]KAI8097135.1 hypothetical protein BX664DRAFT_325638 [Halteromyces radiatus]
MLGSLLRLEDLLKCDLCGNLLRRTNTLKECGHRYCQDCIYDRLGRDRQCPGCHIPAIVKNLRKDPMHDTLVACVQKLKLCMVNAESVSLTMSNFDTDTNTIESLETKVKEESVDDIFEVGFSSSLNPTSTTPSTSMQPPSTVSHTYDNSANSSSSLTRPSPQQSVQQPTTDIPPIMTIVNKGCNTNDLLLAMEDEEPNQDEIPQDIDIEISDHQPIQTTASLMTQSDHIYANTDILLAAMESEEVIMDDDSSDSDIDSKTVPSIVSTHQQMTEVCTTPNRRRFLDNDKDSQQESSSKQRRTYQDTSTLTIPAHMPEKGVTSSRWKCPSCLYGGNSMDQTTCGICRKERTADSLKEQEPTADDTTGTLLPTMNLSTSSDICVPSTIGMDVLTQQQMLQRRRDQGGIIHLMTTALTAEDTACLEISMAWAIETSLKLEVYSEIRDLDNVTHLITSVNEHGLCTRTNKYLLGILTGKWIVNPSWLTDSVHAGYWLPEEKYQVIGDKSSGKTHGPERGRQQQTDALLFGWRFFLYGEFSNHETKLNLLQLIRTGGGKVLLRRPTLHQRNQDRLVIIVPSLEALRVSTKRTDKWLQEYTHVKDSQWLVDSVARCDWSL